MVYVRFKNQKTASIVKETLCCLELADTTAEGIFKVLNTYFSTEELEWKYCVCLCTDGAAAMVDQYSGVGHKLKPILLI